MTYEKNLEAFCQRYPKVQFEAFSWEIDEPSKKPLDRWLKKLKIDQVDLLYIYGLDGGGAYEALKPWLDQNEKRKIVFLVENPGRIAFHLHQNSSFLCDPKVEIAVHFSLETLAEQFPADQVEIVRLPDESRTKFQTIRAQLLQKIAFERSLFVERMHGHLISRQFLKNLPRLNESFYANRLKDTFKGVPAIICGAGPSLEHDLPILKRLDSRAIVIAGGSAVGALTSKGITPHFGIAVDPNLEEFSRFQNSFFFEGPFLFSTRICPEVFSTLNGPFGYLRSGVGSIPELWLEEELGLDEPLLGADLTQNAIAITPLAVAFAHLLGCSPIILTGVDLAYTGGKRYASGVEFKECLKTLAHEKNAVNQILNRFDKTGKKVITAVRWEMERLSLKAFAKMHKDRKWINATQGGLHIEAFEQGSLDKIVANFSQIPNLVQKIDLEIKKHPMPNVDYLADKLKSSLEKVIECLEILAGVKPGSSALAECDLLDEIATSVFLADLPKICRQYFQTEQPNFQDKWNLYLKIAKNHFLFFESTENLGGLKN